MALSSCQHSCPCVSQLSRAFLSPSKVLHSMIPSPSANSHPSKRESVECSLDPLNRKKKDALRVTRDISDNSALHSNSRNDYESASFVCAVGEMLRPRNQARTILA